MHRSSSLLLITYFGGGGPCNHCPRISQYSRIIAHRKKSHCTRAHACISISPPESLDDIGRSGDAEFRGDRSRARATPSWNGGKTSEAFLLVALRSRRRARNAMQIVVVVRGHLQERVRRFQCEIRVPDVGNQISNFSPPNSGSWKSEIEIQIPKNRQLEVGSTIPTFQLPTSRCWMLEVASFLLKVGS